MSELTKAQAKTLKFIRRFLSENGYPPTRAEIAANFDWASANAAEECLRALDRKGAIRLTRGVARGIAVQ